MVDYHNSEASVVLRKINKHHIDEGRKLLGDPTATEATAENTFWNSVARERNTTIINSLRNSINFNSYDPRPQLTGPRPRLGSPISKSKVKVDAWRNYGLMFAGEKSYDFLVTRILPKLTPKEKKIAKACLTAGFAGVVSGGRPNQMFLGALINCLGSWWGENTSSNDVSPTKSNEELKADIRHLSEGIAVAFKPEIDALQTTDNASDTSNASRSNTDSSSLDDNSTLFMTGFTLKSGLLDVLELDSGSDTKELGFQFLLDKYLTKQGLNLSQLEAKRAANHEIHSLLAATDALHSYGYGMITAEKRQVEVLRDLKDQYGIEHSDTKKAIKELNEMRLARNSLSELTQDIDKWGKTAVYFTSKFLQAAGYTESSRRVELYGGAILQIGVSALLLKTTGDPTALIGIAGGLKVLIHGEKILKQKDNLWEGVFTYLSHIISGISEINSRLDSLSTNMNLLHSRLNEVESRFDEVLFQIAMTEQSLGRISLRLESHFLATGTEHALLLTHMSRYGVLKSQIADWAEKTFTNSPQLSRKVARVRALLQQRSYHDDSRIFSEYERVVLSSGICVGLVVKNSFEAVANEILRNSGKTAWLDPTISGFKHFSGANLSSAALTSLRTILSYYQLPLLPESRSLVNLLLWSECAEKRLRYYQLLSHFNDESDTEVAPIDRMLGQVGFEVVDSDLENTIEDAEATLQQILALGQVAPFERLKSGIARTLQTFQENFMTGLDASLRPIEQNQITQLRKIISDARTKKAITKNLPIPPDFKAEEIKSHYKEVSFTGMENTVHLAAGLQPPAGYALVGYEVEKLGQINYYEIASKQIEFGQYQNDSEHILHFYPNKIHIKVKCDVINEVGIENRPGPMIAKDISSFVDTFNHMVFGEKPKPKTPYDVRIHKHHVHGSLRVIMLYVKHKVWETAFYRKYQALRYKEKGSQAKSELQAKGDLQAKEEKELFLKAYRATKQQRYEAKLWLKLISALAEMYHHPSVDQSDKITAIINSYNNRDSFLEKITGIAAQSWNRSWAEIKFDSEKLQSVIFSDIKALNALLKELDAYAFSFATSPLFRQMSYWSNQLRSLRYRLWLRTARLKTEKPSYHEETEVLNDIYPFSRKRLLPFQFAMQAVREQQGPASYFPLLPYIVSEAVYPLNAGDNKRAVCYVQPNGRLMMAHVDWPGNWRLEYPFETAITNGGKPRFFIQPQMPVIFFTRSAYYEVLIYVIASETGLDAKSNSRNRLLQLWNRTKRIENDDTMEWHYDFPAEQLRDVEAPKSFANALAVIPEDIHCNRRYIYCITNDGSLTEIYPREGWRLNYLGAEASIHLRTDSYAKLVAFRAHEGSRYVYSITQHSELILYLHSLQKWWHYRYDHFTSELGNDKQSQATSVLKNVRSFYHATALRGDSRHQLIYCITHRDELYLLEMSGSYCRDCTQITHKPQPDNQDHSDDDQPDIQSVNTKTTLHFYEFFKTQPTSYDENARVIYAVTTDQKLVEVSIGRTLKNGEREFEICFIRPLDILQASSVWNNCLYGDYGTYFARLDSVTEMVVVDSKLTYGYKVQEESSILTRHLLNNRFYGRLGMCFADINGNSNDEAIVVNADRVVRKCYSNSAGRFKGKNKNITQNRYGRFLGQKYGVHFANVLGDRKAKSPDLLTTHNGRLIANQLYRNYQEKKPYTELCKISTQTSYILFAKILSSVKADLVEVSPEKIKITNLNSEFSQMQSQGEIGFKLLPQTFKIYFADLSGNGFDDGIEITDDGIFVHLRNEKAREPNEVFKARQRWIGLRYSMRGMFFTKVNVDKPAQAVLVGPYNMVEFHQFIEGSATSARIAYCYP